jgi:adenosine deaminase
MFGTDLNHEYALLVKEFGFTQIELEHLSLNGIQASFLGESEKQGLTGEFEMEFQKLAKGEW